MGVTGLWRLVEPAGKPVPVETLENKVLAVDISIWLHQVVKGYQDAKGAPLPNAHLIGLFQRLCKLLYFRIKPVFVFDGGFPDLKKETIAKRQDNKNKYHSESERLKRELAVLLSKKTAISSLLGKQISPKKKSSSTAHDNDDLFKLPALPQRDESESESSDDEDTSSGSIVDLHSVDLQSDNFKSMPAKEKYDLLLELKETRKMNSWGKLHTLPKKSDNFSDFQMQRLLKRRKLQECLEETEKEMGDVGMSMNDLESLLNEEGIDTKIESLPTRRIASNNNTRYLLISNVRETLAKAKEKKEAENKPQTSTNTVKTESLLTEKELSDKKDEFEDDLQKAIQMSLACVDEASTSACQSKTDDSWTSFLTDTDYSEASDSEGELEQPDVSSAKAYIKQYSDYTHKAIEKIIAPRLKSGKTKSKAPGVNQVLEELNNEKSVIIDNVALSSSDEESRPEVVNSEEIIITKNSVNDKSLNQIGKNDGSRNEHIESTQASVLYLEHNESDVITLNSSAEGPIQKTVMMDTTEHSLNVKNIDSSDNGDGFEEVPEVISKSCKHDDDTTTNVTKDKVAKQLGVPEETMNENVESTQASIMFIENTEPDVISLDSSAEEPTEKTEFIAKEVSIHVKESNSSDTDDEFEEVVELGDKTRKPVVELMLKIDNIPSDEEDIFADVFSPSHHTNNTEQNDTMNISVKNSNFKNVLLKDESIDNLNETKNKHVLQENNVPITESIRSVDSKSSFEMFVSNDQVIIDNPISAPKNPVTEPIIQSSSTKEPEKTTNDIIKDTTGNTAQTGNVSKRDINTTVDEESNKEYSEINKPVETHKQLKEPLTNEKLNSMVEEIQNEERDLIQEKGRLDRIGRNITEEMTKEAQELLQIFGIPYIVAPMEAEAQCAFLESVKLTDGTITDDSDIWLFGGQTVYKNFFNQKKHVLQYVSERIEKSFNLSREQLILLALLVGSDYTTGVTGVGPVTAMEILASFPFNKKQVLAETSKQVRYAKILDGLKEFKLWVKAGKRTDNTSLKKKLRNVTLSDDFPSMRVVQAYLEPNVEKSEDKFTWGELDITVLRDYAKSKFGWSQHKLDEIIKPVLERMKNRKSQKTVHDYFKRVVEFQTLEDQMSKRVKAAVQKMGPGGENLDENPTDAKSVTTAKKRKRGVKNIKENEEAGPSKPKQRKKQADPQNIVKVVSELDDGKSSIEINIPKTDRYQEIIPQREKDKQHLLENKMKAIEIFRKTKIDRKRKPKKRRPNLPKDKADLSESSSSD